MKAEALLDALAGTLANIKTNNFFRAAGVVDTKAFMKTMHQSQASVQIETPGDTLRDVNAKASADTVADSPESLRDTDGFEGRITFLKAGRRAGKGESQHCIRHAITGGGQHT